MKRVAIIGAGFCGGMVAAHLVREGRPGLAVDLLDPSPHTLRGVAYQAYSARHLLNVPAARMGAWAGEPGHFLEWVLRRPGATGAALQDPRLVASAFLPRNLYGQYLDAVWAETVARAQATGFALQRHHQAVVALRRMRGRLQLHLSDGGTLEPAVCVIATGNLPPRDPPFAPDAPLHTGQYFRNPWTREAVASCDSGAPVLVLGNGLTMVDTVLGLREQGFRGTVHALSPHGFNILSHRHGGLAYEAIDAELAGPHRLRELVAIVHRHVRAVREFGISAEPVVERLRPHVQRLWREASAHERALFMARLRHLWGVARHRVPLHVHDAIQAQRIEGSLQVLAGRVLEVRGGAGGGDGARDAVGAPSAAGVQVRYRERGSGAERVLRVSRVINCTGPETDLSRAGPHFLGAALREGLLTQDSLALGIHANPATFQVLDAAGRPQPDLLTLGSLLRGELWESTAVSELREQARAVAGAVGGSAESADAL
jgi:uncharacterized NAD(P)/FAD-binding protein YdhS